MSSVTYSNIQTFQQNCITTTLFFKPSKSVLTNAYISPETEFTKKQSPQASFLIFQNWSTLGLAYAFLSQIPKSQISFCYSQALDQSLRLLVWRNFLKRFFNSIGGSGFSSGFLHVLNIFSNDIKYLIIKINKNKLQSMEQNINKGRKVN